MTSYEIKAATVLGNIPESAHYLVVYHEGHKPTKPNVTLVSFEELFNGVTALLFAKALEKGERIEAIAHDETAENLSLWEVTPDGNFEQTSGGILTSKC